MYHLKSQAKQYMTRTIKGIKYHPDTERGINDDDIASFDWNTLTLGIHTDLRNNPIKILL